MIINNILILGSTFLTELCVNQIKDKYNVIGYVPSVNPTKEGNIDLPKVDLDTPCDIKLSIQYDKIVKDTENAYNLHTGLLPKYGGTNILDYAIKNKELEQGLTFHKMTKSLDYGPIISKITYPILPNEKAVDLYGKVLLIGPDFLESSLKLLESMTTEQVEKCHKEKPTLHKRGEFKISNKMKEYKLC